MKYVGNHTDGLNLTQKLIDLGGAAKVTSILDEGFNTWIGHSYMVRVKAVAPEGKVWAENRRQNLLFEFETNSTWLQDDEEYEELGDKGVIKEMISSIC